MENPSSQLAHIEAFTERKPEMLTEAMAKNLIDMVEGIMDRMKVRYGDLGFPSQKALLRAAMDEIFLPMLRRSNILTAGALHETMQGRIIEFLEGRLRIAKTQQETKSDLLACTQIDTFSMNIHERSEASFSLRKAS